MWSYRRIKDIDLSPENVRKDVEILGITGTYEGTSGFLVTFDSNGGSEVKAQEIVSGYEAKKPEDPIMEGGVFDTWLLNGEEFDFSTPITEDITLTAKWIEQLINYKFLYDGSLEQTENWSEDTGGYGLVENYSGLGTLTTNSDNMTLQCKVNAGTASPSMFSAMTNNKVELIDYKLACSYSNVTVSNSSNTEYSFLRVRSTNTFPAYNQSTFTGDDISTNTNNTTIKYSQYMSDNNVLLDCDIENVSLGYLYQGIRGGSTVDKAIIYSMFLVKQDNWQELCDIAGLNSSDYTDEAELCTNSDAINTILQNEKAVDYMVYFCTGTFMYNFIRNSANITAINSSPYYDKILNNEHWNKFINMVA